MSEQSKSLDEMVASFPRPAAPGIRSALRSPTFPRGGRYDAEDVTASGYCSGTPGP